MSRLYLGRSNAYIPNRMFKINLFYKEGDMSRGHVKWMIALSVLFSFVGCGKKSVSPEPTISIEEKSQIMLDSGMVELPEVTSEPDYRFFYVPWWKTVDILGEETRIHKIKKDNYEYFIDECYNKFLERKM